MELVPPRVQLHVTDVAGILHFVMVSLHVQGQAVPVSVSLITKCASKPNFVVNGSIVLVQVTLIRKLFTTFFTWKSYSFMDTFTVIFEIRRT